MHLSPFDAHRFTLTLKGTHIYIYIIYPMWRKKHTSITHHLQKWRLFVRDWTFFSRNGILLWAEGNVTLILFILSGIHIPPETATSNVQSPCISVVFSYGFLATELGSFFRFVVRPPNPRSQPGIGSFFWKWLILWDILAERHKFTIVSRFNGFFPFWKICSSNWIISPGRGENKEYLKRPSI